eukprot:449023_1
MYQYCFAYKTRIQCLLVLITLDLIFVTWWLLYRAVEMKLELSMELPVIQKENNTSHLYISIVIPSFCDEEEYRMRDIQRKSWIRYLYDSEWQQETRYKYNHICDVQYHYVIGHCPNKTLNAMLLNEIVKYNDIIRIDINESWNNLARKSIEMLLYEYVDHENYQYDVLFKTDTDCYVNIPILCLTIKESMDKYGWDFESQALYYGKSMNNRPIITNISDQYGKYENALWTQQTGLDHYTRYMEGYSYLLSYKAVTIIYKTFINNMDNMAYNKMEDAYLGHVLSLFKITFYNAFNKIAHEPKISKHFINQYISDHKYVNEETIKMIIKYKRHQSMANTIIYNKINNIANSYTLNTIYYINLPSYIKHRKGILKQINKIKLDFPNVKVERIEPVLCNDSISWFSNVLNFGVNPNRISEDKYFTNISDVTSINKLGCQTVSIYLSHLASLKKIRRKHIKYASSNSKHVYMVLEDDAIMGEDFLNFLNKLIINGANAPHPWYLIKPVEGKYNKSHLVNNYYYNMTMAKHLDWSYYFGAYCIMYNADFVGNIIEQLDKFDTELGDFDLILSKNIDYLYAVGTDSNQFVTVVDYDNEAAVHR